MSFRIVATLLGTVGLFGCKAHQSHEDALSQSLAARSEIPARPSLQNMISANKFVGHATAFENFAPQGGGCGLTEAILKEDTRSVTGGVLAFAALNVANTPGNRDGDPINRGRSDQKTSELGLFAGGKNCGRWIEAQIPWDGQKKPVKFLVADSCYDANTWCRDDPAHVDLSIYQLVKALTGRELSEADRGRGWPINWPNPDVEWKFIDAPTTGPVRIHFVTAAKPYWPTIIISNLPRGISKLYNKLPSGSWIEARMDSDRGQVFVLDHQPSNTYEIKYADYDGKSNGRTYKFVLPEVCKNSSTGCPAPTFAPLLQ
jgi:hypothetical protein